MTNTTTTTMHEVTAEDEDGEYAVEVYDGYGPAGGSDRTRLWQYDEDFTASSVEEAREKAREILDLAARACERGDGYEDGEQLLAILRLPSGSNEHFWITLTEEHLGELPELSPCVERYRIRFWDTEARAEAWWENLSFSTGWDRDWSHPILGIGFDEIDAFDPEGSAVPEEYAEALAADGERAEDARDGLRAVAAYGRRAKRAALTIRAYIDEAIDACERDDGDAMIAALEAASAEERSDWGGDPFAREAADRLLAPGWSLEDGRVVRDDADED